MFEADAVIKEAQCQSSDDSESENDTTNHLSKEELDGEKSNAQVKIAISPQQEDDDDDDPNWLKQIPNATKITVIIFL